MSSEAEREAAASTGDEPRRFLDLLMGTGGGRNGEGFVLFPTIIGVMGPRGGEGEEATAAPPAADRIVLLSPLGMLVLRAEDGGVDLASIVRHIISADGRTAGPPPASKASIEAMRMVERPAAAEAEAGAEEDMEECAVCLDGLWVDGEGKGPEATVKEMPCRHRFHGGCIEKWLGLHGSCPICRYRMPEEEKAGGKKGTGEEGEGEGEEDDDAARRQMEEQQQQQQQQQERQHQEEQAMEDID